MRNTTTLLAISTIAALGLLTTHCGPERRAGGGGSTAGNGGGGANNGGGNNGGGNKGGGPAVRPDDGSFVADDDGEAQVDPAGPADDVVVTSNSGRASVVIPPSALAEPAQITVESRPLSDFEDTDKLLDGIYDFGPDGLQFAEPVTILLPTNGLSGDDLAGAELVVWAEGAWSVVENANVQITPSHVSGQVSHFTPYAVRLPEGLPGMEEGDEEGGEIEDGQGEEGGEEDRKSVV